MKLRILLIIGLGCLAGVPFPARSAVQQSSSPPTAGTTYLFASSLPQPQYVAVYQKRIDTVGRHVVFKESKVFASLEDVTGFLEREEIAEADLVGVWKLTDATKVEMKVAETVVPAPPVKTRKWQKKP